MPREAVIDASALLALLHQEPGADRVAACLPGGLLSAVNLAEVVGKLAETGMPREDIQVALAGLGLQVVAFQERLAYAAGLLRPGTRTRGLSLGDRACIALAADLALPALTADRAWTELALGIEVDLIR